MLTAVTDSTLQFFWFVQTQISSMLCCKREMLSVRACVCVSLYRSTVRLTRCVSVCFPAWVSCSACQLNVNREVLGSQRVSNFNPAIVPLPLLTHRSSGCTACSLQPAGWGGSVQGPRILLRTVKDKVWLSVFVNNTAAAMVKVHTGEAAVCHNVLYGAD